MSVPDWIKTNVSRETFDCLRCYVDLVNKWNPKINLVSKTSLSEIWMRHIWDSAQIVDLNIAGNKWLDIGSGGGFPGIVIAIFSKEYQRDRKFTFIESDQRKCAFLSTIARELDLNVSILSERIEAVQPQKADVISARALTSLEKLLEFSERHGHKNSISVFPKGETWKNELELVKKTWFFDCEKTMSKTNVNATLLKFKGIARGGRH